MRCSPVLFLGLWLAAGAPLAAQGPAQFTEDQLDQLVGPIALYPDVLVAMILPAATTPSDVDLAARYVRAGGDPARTGDQGWPDSVVALAYLPGLIKWLDDNLAWTEQLGEAYGAQPAAVLDAIQRLRTRARADGALVDTPQQEVVQEDGQIRIVPAQPDVIYLPLYDPGVVYYVDDAAYYPDPFLTFDAGIPVGPWLGYGVDWRLRRVRDGQRVPPAQLDWNHPVFHGHPDVQGGNLGLSASKPAATVPAPRSVAANWHPPQISQPALRPGTPPRPPGWVRDPKDRPVANAGPQTASPAYASRAENAPVSMPLPQSSSSGAALPPASAQPSPPPPLGSVSAGRSLSLPPRYREIPGAPLNPPATARGAAPSSTAASGKTPPASHPAASPPPTVSVADAKK